MSQKVVIERVQVRGAAPYLGMSATPDGQQVPLYSTNPDIVMRWLCDGWRCRYNQLRSRRTRWIGTPNPPSHWAGSRTCVPTVR